MVREFRTSTAQLWRGVRAPRHDEDARTDLAATLRILSLLIGFVASVTRASW